MSLFLAAVLSDEGGIVWPAQVRPYSDPTERNTMWRGTWWERGIILLHWILFRL